MEIIVDNGNPASHIDIAIIGSGFTTAEMPEFISKVDGNISKMFTVNWFSDNESLFNIYRVDAESPVSGEDLDIETIYSLVSEIPYNILVVIHNYDGQESVVNPYIDLYTASHNYVVLAHELGHKIGGLDDEYYTPAMAYKCDGLSKRTLNIHDKDNNDKWSDLISTPPFEGARFCEVGLWRPSKLTIMKDSANTTVFDAVGYKAMDLGAGKIIGTIRSTRPGLKISGIQNGDTKCGVLNVEAIASSTVGIERVEFYLVEAGNTSKSIKIDRTYPYEVSIDTTEYDNGQYYLDTIAYDINWNYTRVTRLFDIDNVTVTDIEILVHEALTQDSEYYLKHGVRQDMPGMDRTDEPLTIGVPLSEDSGITTIDQLGIKGTTLQQFRPLAYWPNGNIKWVLVDTQVSIQADEQITINLTDGVGNSEGNLASDFVDHIEVDTGSAQFKIIKANFNMIDEAIINGVNMVTTGNNGGVTAVGFEDVTYTLDDVTQTLVAGDTYTSNNDSDSIAIIEEAGPVRTVIKADGAMKDVVGNRFLDYTVRFYFYKNKSYVKSIVTLRHGREEKHDTEYTPPFYSQNMRKITSMQVSVPLSIGVTKSFDFATRGLPVQGTIDTTAYMFQAYSEAHRNGNTEWDSIDGTKGWGYPPMERTDPEVLDSYAQKGLEIKNGALELHTLSDESDWTGGYAEIKDQNDNGLTIAMQYMSAYWPASIEFNEDGVVEIGIFSKHNSKNDITMGWGTHERRELMLDFHTDPINNLETVYRIEQPIVGRNTIEHYAQSNAFFDSGGLLTEDEYYQFFIDNNGTIDYYHPKSVWQHDNTGVIVWRTYWYCGVQGVDHPLSGLYTYLKTGNGGNYMAGLQKTNYNTDSGIIRTDGFEYGNTPIASDYRYPINNVGSYNSGSGLNHFDTYGHNHWRGMPYFYYLTGNEEIKQAINDYMEEFIRKGAWPYLSYMRSHARYCSTLALGYEFGHDQRLMIILEEMISTLLSSRDNPPNLSPSGRNMDRGYLSMDAENWGESTIHSFFLISIHAQDIWQVYRVINKLNPAYPRIEELDDYLLGISQFIYNELHFEEPAGDDFGFVYDYKINETNSWIDGVVDNNYMRKDDCSRAMLHAYSNTGDISYLTMGNKLLGFGGGTGSSTPFQGNDLIHAGLHGVDNVWRYASGQNISNVGKDYTLSWTVPQGATAYKIKYSERQIVDWLGFDQETRAYQYTPDLHVAYFAATNLINKPTPGTPGTTQELVIDIEAEIVNFNTTNNLLIDDPSYIVYDPSKTYDFSIKYFSPLTIESLVADLNEDTVTNILDYVIIIHAIGKSLGEDGYNSVADYDHTNKVTYSNFQEWYTKYLLEAI